MSSRRSATRCAPGWCSSTCRQTVRWRLRSRASPIESHRDGRGDGPDPRTVVAGLPAAACCKLSTRPRASLSRRHGRRRAKRCRRWSTKAKDRFLALNVGAAGIAGACSKHNGASSTGRNISRFERCTSRSSRGSRVASLSADAVHRGSRRFRRERNELDRAAMSLDEAHHRIRRNGRHVLLWLHTVESRAPRARAGATG